MGVGCVDAFSAVFPVDEGTFGREEGLGVDDAAVVGGAGFDAVGGGVGFVALLCCEQELG